MCKAVLINGLKLVPITPEEIEEWFCKNDIECKEFYLYKIVNKNTTLLSYTANSYNSRTNRLKALRIYKYRHDIHDGYSHEIRLNLNKTQLYKEV